MLSDLLASLDLRFEDPLVESLYYNYYAQVKRQLLPTAIQVVLSVNVLQLCASCLHFYFLANDSTRPLSRPLILPFIIQLAILVLTFAMLKMVRNELDPSDRYGRRRFSSTGQAGNSKGNKSNSRQSSGSGLSASLSLTIRAPLDQEEPSSESESESSSSSSSDDERDPSENKMIQLNKTGSNKAASNEQKKQNNRRSHSSSRHSKVSIQIGQLSWVLHYVHPETKS